MAHKYLKIFLIIGFCSIGFNGLAQTNTVRFGKNRLQHKLFDWRYFQTDHFDTYFSQGGLDLGKYVAQAAESELKDLEKAMDFSLRDRVNIIVYNSYGDMKQSNIGIGLNWQNTGGVTKLVGNKMIVYFDGDHNKLRVQIREGIAKVILNNVMFGSSVGEFAGNAVLLNLPEWYTDGYIAYVAEKWNTGLDNQLKQLIRTGRYRTFKQFANEHPTLAGHAFWFYVADVYGIDAPSYLLYISRIDRNMKKAFEQVLHKKYKEVMRDFITYNYRRYREDNFGRRQITRGTVTTTQSNVKAEHYRIHPNPRNRTYAMIEFDQGNYEVQLYQGYFKPKVLLKSGVRQLKVQVNPDYPILAWDPQGTNLAIIYPKKGKLKLMVYDVISRTKQIYDLPEEYQMIQSFQYLPTRRNELLLSAAKNGQTDLFTYNISTFKSTQLTNDVFDDVDPSYVGFSKKSGVIFSSNRPSPQAVSADTVLPHHRYNVFLLSNWDNPDGHQISQLTNLKMGDARKPMQYAPGYFTFVGDQNGIQNRYAGFFKAESSGLDSLYYIGANILHNPSAADLDSMLAAYGSQRADSIKVVAITSDSTYVFPLTNYADGITESYSAGQKQVVSESVLRGNFVRTYELKVDERALDRRNVSTPLTAYRKFDLHLDSIRKGLPMYYQQAAPDTTLEPEDFFQSEFGYIPPDSTNIIRQNLALEQSGEENDVLKNARLFPYHLKFSTDYLITQLDNSVLISRYQPFTGGGGPIYLQQPFNGLIQVGVSDLFEDIKFTGGFRFPSNFNGSEYYFSYNNLRHYFDYKALYYRKVSRSGFADQNGNAIQGLEAKRRTNLYQVEVNFPIDVVRSVRVTLGYRSDKLTFLASDAETLVKDIPNGDQKFGVTRVEYVYDNTINPAINIWNGLRWKAYIEMFPQLNKQPGVKERNFTFNTGVDARYYLPIYKDFIWATRFAADFSWGNSKVLYYLGGVDNWLGPKYNNYTPIDRSANYAYQTLAVNLRGYDQNIKNGNNVMLLNTELRLPVFATFINQPITSDLIRNFQITSFLDIGTAWHGGFSNLKNNSRPAYRNDRVIVELKSNNLGPFVGGYGFGARTTIAGYFLRVDTAWPMNNGFFYGKPKWYFALGVDF